MEFLGQDVIESGNFFFCEIVLFASCVTYQIEEELEEGSLEIWSCLFGGLILIEDLNYGL